VSPLRLFVLCLMTGCAGGFQVEAKVRNAEAPVAGASVAMDCPQLIKRSSPPSELGVTNASGIMVMHEPALGRWIHDGCVLIVTKDGYETQRVPVEAVCHKYEANHCTRAVLVANLRPAAR